tara:strand:+ start:9029 stop:9529 length:501 start_codon:yes stop_codon:yes gene_type:complete
MNRSFNNENGMQTNVWGPPAWLFLHCIAANYTPDKARGYLIFFNSLKYVLPCGACRKNYTRILKEMLPLTKKVFKSRETFMLWLFMLHNQVQRDIYSNTLNVRDKPKYTDTHKDFMNTVRFYEKFRAKCTKDSYGCTVPLKGCRKRSRILILPFLKRKKANSIQVK